jgi:hypothetical protein
MLCREHKSLTDFKYPSGGSITYKKLQLHKRYSYKNRIIRISNNYNNRAAKNIITVELEYMHHIFVVKLALVSLAFYLENGPNTHLFIVL